jgi:hypothetical protein
METAASFEARKAPSSYPTMIAYWNTLFSRPGREGVKGLSTSLSNFDLAKEGVLQRSTAPTLVITADRSKVHSVEKARA